MKCVRPNKVWLVVQNSVGSGEPLSNFAPYLRKRSAVSIRDPRIVSGMRILSAAPAEDGQNQPFVIR